MDYYLDIRLRPDPEFSPQHLLNALFAKLHRVLAESRASDIGISFPNAAVGTKGLGACLRLHGSMPGLTRLMAQSWLSGMGDLVDVCDLCPVPATATPFAIRRVQVKSSPERLRRRQMKRKGWTMEQAREAIPDSSAQTSSLPFLSLSSRSTGQRFRLFIRQIPVERHSEGDFNSYGLSTTATLPMF